MNIQIFGTKKCNDTKKAQCYFNPKGTEAWADEFETFIFQDRKKIKIIDADTVTLLKYFAKFKDRYFSVADVSDESICEW